MFKRSSLCSALCPGVHVDQDIGGTAITGREFPLSILHKPLTSQMWWSPALCAPRAARGCHHTRALLLLKSTSRRFVWVANTGCQQPSLLSKGCCPVKNSLSFISLLLSGCTVPKLWDFFLHDVLTASSCHKMFSCVWFQPRLFTQAEGNSLH